MSSLVHITSDNCKIRQYYRLLRQPQSTTEFGFSAIAVVTSAKDVTDLPFMATNIEVLVTGEMLYNQSRELPGQMVSRRSTFVIYERFTNLPW